MPAVSRDLSGCRSSRIRKKTCSRRSGPSLRSGSACIGRSCRDLHVPPCWMSLRLCTRRPACRWRCIRTSLRRSERRRRAPGLRTSSIFFSSSFFFSLCSRNPRSGACLIIRGLRSVVVSAAPIPYKGIQLKSGEALRDIFPPLGEARRPSRSRRIDGGRKFS